jgi:hypothetical protein
MGSYWWHLFGNYPRPLLLPPRRDAGVGPEYVATRPSEAWRARGGASPASSPRRPARWPTSIRPEIDPCGATILLPLA